MAKHPTSADSKILDRIRVHRRGWVFTPAHLAVDITSFWFTVDIWHVR